MAVNQKIAELRKSRGLTQGDLAAKLYVTRQAVSRWENGETSPGIDMLKLLAVTLDVPITELLELPPEGTYCQCCGMPFFTDKDHAVNPDGTPSQDWCADCVKDGEFMPYRSTMEGVIETCAPYMVESGSFANLDEAVSLLGAVLPQLKRWKAQGPVVL